LDINPVDMIKQDLRAEALGMLLKSIHKFGAKNPGMVGRPVIDVGGCHQLTALGQTGNQNRTQIRAGCVNSGGVAGRATTKNKELTMFFGHDGVTNASKVAGDCVASIAKSVSFTVIWPRKPQTKAKL
jgi:hypothetical protein